MSILEITTTLGCRVACTYCPQELYIKEYIKRDKTKDMSLNTLKVCLDNIPKGVLEAIVFSGYSEPFLNPECTSMILHCLNRSLPVQVYSTMVGITLADIDKLKGFPLKWVVHIPDNRQLTKIEVNDHYFNLLERLIKTFNKVAFLFTHGGRLFEYVHPKVLAFLNTKRMPFTNHLKHSRAGLLGGQGMAEFRIPGKLKKCWRLKANVLLPNGDVTLCCQDFGQKHLLGNLLKSNYESLFSSEEFKNVEVGLKDESRDCLCRQCVMYSYPESRMGRYYHLLFRLGPPYARMRILSAFNEMVRRIRFPAEKDQKSDSFRFS